MIKYAFVYIAVLLSSCAYKPYRIIQKRQNKKIDSLKKEISLKLEIPLLDSLQQPIEVQYVPAINFGLRKPNFVIIHHTAQDSVAQTIKTFSLDRTQVSAHYIISASGKIIHLLNNNLRAWHAGVAKWGNISDINSCSIGIELDNNGLTAFTPQQINSLITLLKNLKTAYKIPAANFIGHADIAPHRKTDPSVFFPWKLLSDNGFGLWYDNPDLPPPADFDTENALRRIGYNTSNMAAAIVAFKVHFIKIDVSPTLSDWDKCVLWNLYKKY